MAKSLSLLSLERETEVAESEGVLSSQLQNARELERRGVCLQRLRVRGMGKYLLI